MRLPDTDGSSAPAEHASKPFFSGPLGPDETQRLLDAIDARLRLRASFDHPEPGGVGQWVPAGPTDAGAAAPMIEAGLAPDALDNLTAPLFNVRHGGVVARAVRAVLNLPLRLFGRPQAYFNHEVRRVLTSWAAVLRASLDLQATIERRIAVHVSRLERLSQQEAELEYTVTALRRLLASGSSQPRQPLGARPSRPPVPTGPTLEFDHPTGSRDHIEVRAKDGSTVRVAADLATPPFTVDSVAEVLVRHLVERYPQREVADRLLPLWRSLLAPGGLLRIVCCDWEAALDLYRGGHLDAQQLRAISFGDPGAAGHRTMYTRSSLVVLLEAAGFVNCSVTLLPGDLQSCPEMEVAGARPPA